MKIIIAFMSLIILFTILIYIDISPTNQETLTLDIPANKDMNYMCNITCQESFGEDSKGYITKTDCTCWVHLKVKFEAEKK